MLLTLASTALLMGLTGGAHCLAMCAAPCGVLAGASMNTEQSVRPVHWVSRASYLSRNSRKGRLLGFHMGRLLGYGMVGAAGALAMERLAWLGQFSPALRPVWSMAHVLVLAWGVLMVCQARQPVWIEVAGRHVWMRVRPLVARPAGVFAAGVVWALLPCGLLYTALLMAALSGSVLKGAVCMLMFGVGSGLWLVAGPWVWRWLRGGAAHAVDGRREDGNTPQWGARLAGLVLVVMGAWALWMDVVHGQVAPWCVS